MVIIIFGIASKWLIRLSLAIFTHLEAYRLIPLILHYSLTLEYKFEFHFK